MDDPLGGCETYQLSISNQNKLHASYDPDVKNTTIIVENRNPLAKAIVDDFELTAQMLTEDK